MGILSSLFRKKNPARDKALEILGHVIDRALDGASTLAEFRERLAQSAKAGDLDDVVTTVIGAKRAAELYVKFGTVPP